MCRWLSSWQRSRNKQRSIDLVSDCIEMVSDCNLMVLLIWSQTSISQSCQSGLRLQSHGLVNPFSDYSLAVLLIQSQAVLKWSQTAVSYIMVLSIWSQKWSQTAVLAVLLIQSQIVLKWSQTHLPFSSTNKVYIVVKNEWYKNLC